MAVSAQVILACLLATFSETNAIGNSQAIPDGASAGNGAAHTCVASVEGHEGDPHEESAMLQLQRSPAKSGSPNASGLVQESPLLGNRTINVSGFTFSCIWTPAACKRKLCGKEVLLLHGFPDWKETWADLMEQLARSDFCAAACDQRGYSPGASPPLERDYRLEELKGDVAGFADAFGFRRFHLVGHDFGAVLGWLFAASKGLRRRRVLSFTSLAIPHPTAFSHGLYGKKADLDQQAASQYFEIFTRPNSASLENQTLYMVLGAPFSPTQQSLEPPGLGWASPQDFQKALWWYNAAVPTVMAKPPLLPVEVINDRGFPAMAQLRAIFGGEPNSGEPARLRTGKVLAPTLFVCGSQDDSILCTKPFSRATRQYVKGEYRYLEVECGHVPQHCADAAQTAIVTGAILDHIKSH